jgi:hypothetical protein
MTLDAEFAARIEEMFGNVRKGENFPGLLQLTVPASMASAIHQYWAEEVKDKLSEAAVMRFKQDLEQISHGQYSARARSAGSGVGSNPGLEDEFYEANNYYNGGGDDDGWTEVKLVPKNVQRYVAQDVCHYLSILNNPTFRSEIIALRQRRVELYQKAAAEYKKKTGAAGYYSEEGRSMTAKINGLEADFRYKLFVDSNPLGSNKVDLHGLTAAEAVERLQWWVEAKQKELVCQDCPSHTTKKLEVVTGRGLGSRGGKVRIKPAVESFLREAGISHSEGSNEGVIDVVIRK